MGLAMASKRKRKTTPLMPAWATKPPIDPRLADERGITHERRQHAEGAYEYGHDERDRETVLTMRDTPIDRALARGVISANEYAAAIKYRHHWYHAGLCGTVQSVDLNRIFARDEASFSGMAKTENQAFHRQQYRSAQDAIGMRCANVVEYVGCYELALSEVGKKLGWNTEAQARAAASELLKLGLGGLTKLWGI